MSAGTVIFHNALKVIGAYSIAAQADPEADVDLMNMYNSMIIEWFGLEIKAIDGNPLLNPIKVPGEELGEPLDTKLAIEYNLAVLAFPLFHAGNKPLSPVTSKTAERLLNYLKTVYQDVTIPKMVVSSTLPRGEGVSPVRNQGPYFDRGETIGN